MKKPPSGLSLAEIYHQETRCSVDKRANVVDPLTRPALFKDYLSERKVALKEAEGAKLSAELGSLARILHSTCGITQVRKTAQGTGYLRAAPSGGGLYPIEVYVATRGVDGLPDCIHGYSPREHALVPLWDGDLFAELVQFSFNHPALSRARIVLIFTAVWRRSAWLYGERAYRRILLDAGHLLGNAAAYAAEEGYRLAAIGGFHDAAVSDLLFLDRHEEVVLALAPLLPAGEGSVLVPAFPPPSERGKPERAAGSGLMQLLHLASQMPAGQPAEPPRAPMDADARGPARPWIQSCRPPVEPAKNEALAAGRSLARVIAARRTAKTFAPAALGSAKLWQILRSAFAPASRYFEAVRREPPGSRERPGLREPSGSREPGPFLDPTMIGYYLVVTRVEGMDPGIWRLDLKPESGGGFHLDLLLERSGVFQTDLSNSCLGQEAAREAAAGLLQAAALPACVERYGERAYRYLHLDAGHLSERINLAAVGRGASACGIGTFFDEEARSLLDLPDSFSVLHVTLLGQPVSKSP